MRGSTGRTSCAHLPTAKRLLHRVLAVTYCGNLLCTDGDLLRSASMPALFTTSSVLAEAIGMAADIQHWHAQPVLTGTVLGSVWMGG
jgi:hypothetical protein